MKLKDTNKIESRKSKISYLNTTTKSQFLGIFGGPRKSGILNYWIAYIHSCLQGFLLQGTTNVLIMAHNEELQSMM